MAGSRLTASSGPAHGGFAGGVAWPNAPHRQGPRAGESAAPSIIVTSAKWSTFYSPDHCLASY